MRRLILIKHARPQVDPSLPSEVWTLGDEGRAGASKLIEPLRAYPVARLYSSTQAKAKETAEIVGRGLDKPVETLSDLCEHDRRNVPHMESREFISMIALFFKEPDRLVLGDETADEAYDRFAAAVDGILRREIGDVAIVTHGTVIALFAQRRARQEPFALWRRMGQPSFIVFDTATWRVLETG